MIVSHEPKVTKQFQVAPAGSYMARLYRIVDLGTQKVEWQGQVKMQRKIKFFWELHGEDDQGNPLTIGEGKPLIQTKNYTLSLSEKSNLRKDLESWRAKPFSDEELKGFNLKNILNKFAMLSIAHREANGNTYADCVAVSPVPAALKKLGEPEGVNPAFIFDLQNFNQQLFDSLSEGMKNIIQKSAEWQNRNAKSSANTIVDDDIPF